MDPEAILQLVDKPEVAALAAEVRGCLNRVCTAVSAA
jgi:hypothetical protein